MLLWIGLMNAQAQGAGWGGPGPGPGSVDGPEVAGPSGSQGEVEEQGIVAGELVLDPRDEVVALGFLNETTGRLDSFCTGSLVHPEWVLTAAHCIVPASEGPAGARQVAMWGNDEVRFTEAIAWAETFLAPGYSGGGDVINDIALIRLERPHENPVLMVLNDTPLDDTWLGVPLTFYGFGVTADGLSDSGLKRTTTIPIDEVTFSDVSTFLAGTNVCFGDSGGPSTYEGPDGPEQVGVSSTVDPGCVGGGAESARVDVQLPWMLELVPELILDYADLPGQKKPELPADGTRRWDDLGADSTNGIAPVDGVPLSGGGCSHHGGFSAFWGAWLLLGLARFRPRHTHLLSLRG